MDLTGRTSLARPASTPTPASSRPRVERPTVILPQTAVRRTPVCMPVHGLPHPSPSGRSPPVVAHLLT